MQAVRRFRLFMLAVWVVVALLVVGTALAQDGEDTPQPETFNAGSEPPRDLDDIAVKLTPLLVGAALIERTLEFLFNWVERALLDASHSLHTFLARVAGLVQVDVHNAWVSMSELSAAFGRRQANPDLAVADPDSPNPEDWPLAVLEERLERARALFEQAQRTIEAALKSPVYVARKKLTAMVLSLVFGVTLALTGNLRLFEPLGVQVASQIAEPFRLLDTILAGVLMGLGTDWVHQVVGLLVNGKGLLGRAATGPQIDPDQIVNMTSTAVQEEFGRQLNDLRSRVLGGGPGSMMTVSAAATATPPAPDDEPAADSSSAEASVTSGLRVASAGIMPFGITPAPQGAAGLERNAQPEDFLPLHDVQVTVQEGGTAARAEPSLDAETLGTLPEGTRREADGLVFGEFTWLRTPWEGPESEPDQDAWIPGEDTDFPRSTAYNQVDGSWYESEAVLAFRRSLVRDLLRVRNADRDRIAEVDTLSGAALEELEVALTRETIPPLYHDFWAMQLHLGLPDPFTCLPVQTTPPAGIEAMGFSGFGPTTYALDNWMYEYDASRGLHPGVDYLVPEGTPLIAVADGVIVEFPFLHDPADRSLALRPFLPEKFRRDDGSRVLSNVIVGYGHVSADSPPLVHAGQEVRAGEIIGNSGCPMFTTDEGSVIAQRNNPHLHLEVHFVTDGRARLDAQTPLNPLLFFTPRLVAWQARLATQRNGAPYPSDGQPFGRLGFFSVGAFSYEPATIVWDHQVTRSEPWPEGVYPLDGLLDWARSFEPYPLDGAGPF